MAKYPDYKGEYLVRLMAWTVAPAGALDRVAEDLHDLSSTGEHPNFYAFAEGIAFAAWLLRTKPVGTNTEQLYLRYLKEVETDDASGF